MSRTRVDEWGYFLLDALLTRRSNWPTSTFGGLLQAPSVSPWWSNGFAIKSLWSLALHENKDVPTVLTCPLDRIPNIA